MFPLSLHWYAEPSALDGYDYVFVLQVDAEFAGNVDGIVFADVGNGAPADADALVNVSLVGDPPAPFGAIDAANGSHDGPTFENHPSAGWTPDGVGDSLTWHVHADNLATVLYWSTTRGDWPYADYELAVNDCTLASAPPPAARHVGVCEGLAKVCDFGTRAFVEPDYTAIDGFEQDESTCDGLDNDCDGATDDIAEPPLADVQEGVCAGARKVCPAGAWVEPDYRGLDDFQLDEDRCDGLDNDCDGKVDAYDPESGLRRVPTDYQDGVCAGSLLTCDASGELVEPDWWAIPGFEDTETLCDLVDNDCDGRTDEPVECAQITTGCGCAETGAGPWLGALGAVALLAKRRRAR